MTQESRLEKTNRINLLFAFYERLLTEKQQTFLKYYFHDDFSLGEIAAEFEISRQAVYEHIKRAEQTLENYEAKLALLQRHESRMQEIRVLETMASSETLPEDTRQELGRIADKLQSLE
ncbi:YlxM family DNA-binding protein [Saccharibacillus sp. CPCC 101409]|uniref:YlxM family DNA-binding protein n=1 Tax=Saccharibacillus sp. CPCC 101409 TaxID=3058041 RepID=UPI002672A304|nr:YlxM family DNA-binding protein [Saccharibacillus sp. CPCC 101409]MDO3410729.1 YlxM family DNA-binding protein [Saccharibacillus sp. CPCC 101409]